MRSLAQPGLGLHVGDELPVRARLTGVADVGEGELGAGVAQQCPEGERITIERRAVVGDDGVEGHAVKDVTDQTSLPVMFTREV